MKFNLMYGDCLERMKSIPDNSIDAVITSPPYNMNLRIMNGKYCSRQVTKELTTKYNNFSDNMTMDEYYNFSCSVIDECLRVSKLIFYNVQILTGNKLALFKLIGKYSNRIKDVIVWDKINSQPAIGAGVLNSQFEIIIVFDKHNPISRKFNSAKFKRGTLSNLWRIKRGTNKFKCHKAVFPFELVEVIIRNFTSSSDRILDPFMGIGTVGLLCKKLNRNFIGIEKDSEYFSIAVDRIKSKK